MEYLEPQLESPEKEPKKEKHIFSNVDFANDGHSKTNFNIKVIGIGGAGCNVINYINTYRPDINDACTLYAFNTDVGSFNLMKNIDNLFILNKEQLRGYGSGGKPEVGAAAVIHDKEIIKQELAHTDILFIIAGLGKGTGSGGAPEIAKIAKELNILTVAIINLPSIKSEGNTIYNNAFTSLQTLANYADSICTISNEKIISSRKDISFYDAYAYANSIIGMIISEITNIVFKPSQINVDFSDLRSFFLRNKFFMANHIKIANNNVDEQEIHKILKASLTGTICDVEIKNAKEVITNLKLSKKTNTQIVSNIKNAFALITGNELINLVSGIDYHDEDSIWITYLVPGGSLLPEFKLIEEEQEETSEPTIVFSDEDYDALMKDVEAAANPTEDVQYIEETTKIDIDE